MRVSDAYIQKGDYLKISNIQIGYTFPKNVLKPVKMEKCTRICHVSTMYVPSLRTIVRRSGSR